MVKKKEMSKEERRKKRSKEKWAISSCNSMFSSCTSLPYNT